MAVICNECGKLYDVEPELIEQLKNTSFRIRCDACGSLGLLSEMIQEAEEEKKTRMRSKAKDA